MMLFHTPMNRLLETYYCWVCTVVGPGLCWCVTHSHVCSSQSAWTGCCRTFIFGLYCTHISYGYGFMNSPCWWPRIKFRLALQSAQSDDVVIHTHMWYESSSLFTPCCKPHSYCCISATHCDDDTIHTHTCYEPDCSMCWQHIDYSATTIAMWLAPRQHSYCWVCIAVSSGWWQCNHHRYMLLVWLHD